MTSQKQVLVLIPSSLELSLFEISNRESAAVELCGIGPVLAAANATHLIGTLQPSRVILCGIAGSYSDTVPTGTAWGFRSVCSFGIGAGTGPEHRTSAELGWEMLGSGESDSGNCFELDTSGLSDEQIKGQLVTVCSASGHQAEAAVVAATYPHALAEEMEGFAVAAAAGIFNVPLAIVRGISNFAGDRNHANWDVPAAMHAVSELVSSVINLK